MRIFITILFCYLSVLVASTRAEKTQSVESAAQRWAEGGSGGRPDFVRHVVPLFSRLGCNNRACHGSFQGQSGFRLSLFGFEPTEDLRELLEDDGDGLRANVEDPDASLVLFKPTHEDEHEGGQRMTIGSWQHRMFRQWIADGAMIDAKSDLAVLRLEISPSEIVVDGMDQKENVALQAIAHFSDGTAEDVTGLTMFSSNDEVIAQVSDDGEVTVSRTGDTAIIARYAGSVTSTQVLVPAPDDGQPYPMTFPHNRIDEFVSTKLRKLNIRPSNLCSEPELYTPRLFGCHRHVAHGG